MRVSVLQAVADLIRLSEEQRRAAVQQLTRRSNLSRRASSDKLSRRALVLAPPPTSCK